MRLKSLPPLTRVGQRFMIVDPDADAADTTRVYTLNETAASLWTLASESADGFTPEMLADELVKTYGVDHDTAMADVETLIGEWRDLGLLLVEN